jgi:hypothetical protein
LSWAIEHVPNPAALRIHTRWELTQRTIETCPPGSPPEPLPQLLSLASVRSLDLHRYRARINLTYGARRDRVAEIAKELLGPLWGPPRRVPVEPGERVFSIASLERIVAESIEMARGSELAITLFRLPGVAEVRSQEGLLHLRIGRLFEWVEVEHSVEDALARLYP